MTSRRPRGKGTQRATGERAFEKTFRATADAAGWHDPFHVIDQGQNARIRALIAQLHGQGMHEAAELLGRIGRTRVTSAGYPDWTLKHTQYGIIVAELKSDRRDAKATDEQIDWLQHFALSLRPPDNPYAPGRAHLWRPRHWPAIDTQFGLVTNPAHCPCAICDWLRARAGHTTIGDEN